MSHQNTQRNRQKGATDIVTTLNAGQEPSLHQTFNRKQVEELGAAIWLDRGDRTKEREDQIKVGEMQGELRKYRPYYEAREESSRTMKLENQS